jgi:hypothetical protein
MKKNWEEKMKEKQQKQGLKRKQEEIRQEIKHEKDVRRQKIRSLA